MRELGKDKAMLQERIVKLEGIDLLARVRSINECIDKAIHGFKMTTEWVKVLEEMGENS